MSIQTTFGQKILLTLGVPLFLFGIVESGCRILGFPERLRGASGTMEMPRWIETSDRAGSIQAHLNDRPESLEWMKLFRPGRGFRVHLEPNRDEMITNTFSLISVDRSKEYHLHSNSLGFRGRELAAAKSPGTFRVLIFGDSTSFGWGVDDKDTYASVLERSLSEKLGGAPVEVGNFAVPGDSTEFGRLIAEKYLPQFAADFVIFGFGANDAHLTYTPHHRQVERFRQSGMLQDVRSVLQESAFIGTITTIADRSKTQQRPAGTPRAIAVPLEEYRQNVASLLSLARTNGAEKSLLFAICAPGNYRKAAEQAAGQSGNLFLDGQELLTSSIPSLKSGVIYPELVKEMRDEYSADLAKNDVFYITNDGCHPNKVGYRLIGETLATMIAPVAAAKSIAK